MAARLYEFYQRITNDLDRTMDFWLEHSHDETYGGFFNCLSKDGKVYDRLKHVWLQARQVWTYCRLYNEVERFRRDDILQAALKGMKFLQKYAKDPQTSKCHLVLTQDGKAVKNQRSIFSECFYLMALSEMGRASGDSTYATEALQMMDKIVYWVREDDTDLGQPAMEGAVPISSLAVPMMLLCLMDQLETVDPKLETKYSDLTEWCLTEVKKHIQRDGTVILENVSPGGEELPGSMGRLMLPGHSIEAGWFLLQHAIKKGKDDVKKMAIEKFILNPFKYGWDQTYGGLMYFLDVDNWSPTQLEWDMKLWWAHNEALIAFLMVYKETKDNNMMDSFAKIFDYSYSHFVDEDNGEWYGYLNRNGEISMSFKGGPWKGCFHVPRYLMMCEKMLKELKS
ncbi:N-acylglucosamine 2-epimerase-like [Argopecten irradians]|uniref:N-acylglucosamine 2-epimerase-like n=1 Tax=Argopecten irradians TaxID=31199 RepID=UPI0037196830